MKRVFDMDSKFNVIMRKVADLIILNIIFVITCIPIITVGVALTSMYEVTLKMVKNEESYIIKSYLKAFKSNIKKCMLVGIGFECIAAFLALDFWIVGSKEGAMWSGITMGLSVITILVLMVGSYIFPILAKFEDTTKNIAKSALFMSIGFLPVTMGVVIINCAGALCFFCFDSFEVIFYLVAIYSVIGFALTAFLNSVMLVGVFEKFYK